MVRSNAPDRLHCGASLPHRPRVERGKVRAKIAKHRIARVNVLAMAAGGARSTSSATARVVHRRVAGRAPRVETRVVIARADACARAVAIESAVERIVVRRLRTALATIECVGVRPNGGAVDHPTIARLAADRAPHRHPKARLPDVAHGASVAARTGVIAVRFPLVWRQAAMPLRQVGVHRVAGLG